MNYIAKEDTHMIGTIGDDSRIVPFFVQKYSIWTEAQLDHAEIRNTDDSFGSDFSTDDVFYGKLPAASKKLMAAIPDDVLEKVRQLSDAYFKKADEQRAAGRKYANLAFYHSLGINPMGRELTDKDVADAKFESEEKEAEMARAAAAVRKFIGGYATLA